MSPPARSSIGLSYPDLAALAKLGLVKIDDGDFAAIGNALVDDINKHGGVDGRQLQLFTAKYSVLDHTEQLAACTQLTQDDKVFMILGGFIGDNNLCAIQQYTTGRDLRVRRGVQPDHVGQGAGAVHDLRGE